MKHIEEDSDQEMACTKETLFGRTQKGNARKNVIYNCSFFLYEQKVHFNRDKLFDLILTRDKERWTKPLTVYNTSNKQTKLNISSLTSL